MRRRITLKFTGDIAGGRYATVPRDLSIHQGQSYHIVYLGRNKLRVPDRPFRVLFRLACQKIYGHYTDGRVAMDKTELFPHLVNSGASISACLSGALGAIRKICREIDPKIEIIRGSGPPKSYYACDTPPSRLVFNVDKLRLTLPEDLRNVFEEIVVPHLRKRNVTAD